MSNLANQEQFSTKLQEKILNHLADLIPEEKMKGMVDKAINDYFNVETAIDVSLHTAGESWGRSSARFLMTPFNAIVFSYMNKLAYQVLSEKYTRKDSTPEKLSEEQAQAMAETLFSSSDNAFEVAFAQQKAIMAQMADQAYTDAAKQEIKNMLVNLQCHLAQSLPYTPKL